MLTALFLYYKEIIGNCIAGEYKDLISVDPPKDSTFGDFSTNIAMVLSKRVGRNSLDIASDIFENLKNNKDFERLAIKNPGFINWFIPKRLLIEQIPNTLDKNFGQIDMANGCSINIEYVSANPTGPTHAGHTRGAVSGDVLANLLNFVGYRVTREFYINDAGKQIDILAKSLHHRYLELFGREEGVLPNWAYPGEYLIETAKKVIDQYGDVYLEADEEKWSGFFREFAVSDMLKRIKEDLAALGVHHDVFTSEAQLIDSGAVDRAVDLIKNKGFVYKGVLKRPKGGDSGKWEEREQLLFKSTDFGDDVDRPLQKSDGSWTYFSSDIAYHMDKMERGFDEMIDFWGADHGGYIKRMQAAVSALSDNKKKLEVKLVQLVRLMEDGRETKMSKRAGNFVTSKDIVEKVGKDVVRFIMLTRRDDASLDFDFKKVVEQSRENPVFYVQYAYARTHSVLKLFKQTFDKEVPVVDNIDLNLLDMESDMKLIKIIADWPRQVAMAAKSREPHRIAFFLSDLAAVFHSLWNQGKEDSFLRFILPNDFEKTCAKMVLMLATQNVIESAFNIMGITPIKELR